MSKIISKVSPGSYGHLHLDFEDGTSEVIHRGSHEKHELRVGDNWPPLPAEEVQEVAKKKLRKKPNSGN